MYCAFGHKHPPIRVVGLVPDAAITVPTALPSDQESAGKSTKAQRRRAGQANSLPVRSASRV
jgi:hypothetical protein